MRSVDELMPVMPMGSDMTSRYIIEGCPYDAEWSRPRGGRFAHSKSIDVPAKFNLLKACKGQKR
jgi:hypothetical protein